MKDNEYDAVNFDEVIEQSVNKVHSESNSTALERPSKNTAQRIAVIVFFFTLVALIWSSQAELEITVSTRGEILLDSDIEKIQHLEGGMLLELYVAPGDIVYKGQKIALIKATDKENELVVTTYEIAAMQVENLKYTALLENTELDLSAYKNYPELVATQYNSWIEERNKNRSDAGLIEHDYEHKTQLIASMKRRITSSNNQLGLIRKQLTIKERLYAEEMASYVDVLNMLVQESNMVREIENLHESILNENFQLSRMKKQLSNMQDTLHSKYLEKLTTIRKDLNIKETQYKTISDKVSRLMVYSPVDGTVDKLNYNYISAIISPGDSIAEITPLKNMLHGQIKIPRKSIGFIEKGQLVKLKLDTYNFANYGVINGVISSISRGSYSEEDEDFYLAEITIEKNYLMKKGVKYGLSPYMEFTADVKTGSRRVIDYALKPVMAALAESFNER